MAEESNHTPEQIELLKKIGEVHLKLQHYRSFRVELGKWKPEDVLPLVEIRREAVDLAKAALEAGLNRGTMLESLLMDLGIHAEYPTF